MIKSKLLAVLLGMLASMSAWAQLPAAAPLSQRVVHYQIDARWDPSRHVIHGEETLSYINLTGQPLDTFPFHLYLNAFSPGSTWGEDLKRSGSGFRSGADFDPRYPGSNSITHFEVEGMGDLTRQIEYIAPDDGNKNDRTVAQVKLPQPVAPGATVNFKIGFDAQLPKIIARTGFERDFVLAGQWFPKVGVWWDGQWNCHQFHAFTEFFADYGTYDVKVTLPKEYVFGATGKTTGVVENPNGTRTYVQHADDVHDFAWTADPHYKVVETDWQSPTDGHSVHIRLLIHPEHLPQTDRHLDTVKRTLTLFDQRYGVYPYDILTIVDPAHGATEAGGMEYPTFITAGTHTLVPRGLLLTEGVVEHEFGHQYWYGMVGTNEFEDAWLDEGINSYAEVKNMDTMFGASTSFANIAGINIGERDLQRMQYLGALDYDPMVRKGWQFASYGSYGGVTYGKTATVFLTLESVIGEATLQRALRTYFERTKFTHPHREDVLKIIEETSGQDLRWYWDQAVYGTNVLDYEVAKIYTIDGDDDKPPAPGGASSLQHSFVLLHRKGDFLFPVTLEVRFANGERLREHWDGKDRWMRFEYVNKPRIVSAEVDPDHQVLLDRDMFNNSKTADAHPRAALKLANLWMFIVQMVEQAAAALA